MRITSIFSYLAAFTFNPVLASEKLGFRHGKLYTNDKYTTFDIVLNKVHINGMVILELRSGANVDFDKLANTEANFSSIYPNPSNIPECSAALGAGIVIYRDDDEQVVNATPLKTEPVQLSKIFSTSITILYFSAKRPIDSDSQVWSIVNTRLQYYDPDLGIDRFLEAIEENEIFEFFNIACLEISYYDSPPLVIKYFVEYGKFAIPILNSTLELQRDILYIDGPMGLQAWLDTVCKVVQIDNLLDSDPFYLTILQQIALNVDGKEHCSFYYMPILSIVLALRLWEAIETVKIRREWRFESVRPNNLASKLSCLYFAHLSMDEYSKQRNSLLHVVDKVLHYNARLYADRTIVNIIYNELLKEVKKCRRNLENDGSFKRKLPVITLPNFSILQAQSRDDIVDWIIKLLENDEQNRIQSLLEKDYLYLKFKSSKHIPKNHVMFEKISNLKIKCSTSSVGMIVLITRLLSAIQRLLRFTGYKTIHSLVLEKATAISKLESFFLNGYLCQFSFIAFLPKVVRLEEEMRKLLYAAMYHDDSLAVSKYSSIWNVFSAVSLVRVIKPYSPLIETEYKLSDFIVRDIIADGNFGFICLAQENSSTDRLSGEFCVIKIISKDRVVNYGDQRQTDREGKYLSKINNHVYVDSYGYEYEKPHIDSPFIVKQKGRFQTPNFLYIVMEYLSGGTLHSFYRKLHGKLLKVPSQKVEECLKFHAVQILLGLEKLHLLKLVHRDIKLLNILLDADGNAKIVDFNMAQSVRKRKATECYGKYCYHPPELQNRLLVVFYGTEIDYYMFGSLLYEAITGQTFGCLCKDDLNNPDLFSNVMSKTLVDLISQLVNPDKSVRLSSLERIKNHLWFANVDWKMFEDQKAKAPMKPDISLIDYEKLEPLDLSHLLHFPDEEEDCVNIELPLDFPSF